MTFCFSGGGIPGQGAGSFFDFDLSLEGQTHTLSNRKTCAFNCLVY